jgi:hypothetical protein
MKKILTLAAIALTAAPAFAGGILAQAQIPVVMLIDKTVILTIDPAEILLTLGDPSGVHPLYRGYTAVTMTHNFPVLVTVMIVPFGPSLGPTAKYLVALADYPQNLPQNRAEWILEDDTDEMAFDIPAPPPVGRIFYVGAAVNNVDITYIPSSPHVQRVATVLLTVNDNL